MKLLFLADYKALYVLGRRATGYRWVKWLYGPFSREVLDDLDALYEKDVMDVEESVEGWVFYRPTSANVRVRIPEDVRRILDWVVDEYGGRSLEDVLKEVYGLKEVRSTEMGEEILGGG